MAKPISINHTNIRKSAGENQVTFWKRHGVTQSAGSRYESGRSVPKPLRMLLALAAGKATVDQLVSGELAARI